MAVERSAEINKRKNAYRIIKLGLKGAAAVTLAWSLSQIAEMQTGRDFFPGDNYGECVSQKEKVSQITPIIGFYEEFPNPWRLAKLKHIDFPVQLAIAANSREEFIALREKVLNEYPQVSEVLYWPLLSHEDGYYPAAWSDAHAVEKTLNETRDVPILLDSEGPLHGKSLSFFNWWKNSTFLDEWLTNRTASVDIWRSYNSMGLNPLFLRLIHLHFDPKDYPNVTLHLDLYENGKEMSESRMRNILTCGVNAYGDKFAASFGVLNDGEGDFSDFVDAKILKRNLTLAKKVGVTKVWLFGVNGITPEIAKMIEETLIQK